MVIYWHRLYTANPLCNIKSHWTGSKILYTIKSGSRLLCKRLPTGNQCICASVRTASIKTGRFLPSFCWLSQLPRDVPADAGFLCGKVAVLGAAIKETPCTEVLTQKKHKTRCRCDVFCIHQRLVCLSQHFVIIIIIIITIIIITYLTVNVLSPGGSGYNACTWIRNKDVRNLSREGYMRSMQ